MMAAASASAVGRIASGALETMENASRDPSGELRAIVGILRDRDGSRRVADAHAGRIRYPLGLSALDAPPRRG
jgi:hypothetical protein